MVRAAINLNTGRPTASGFAKWL